MTVEITTGDCVERMAGLAAGSVQCLDADGVQPLAIQIKAFAPSHILIRKPAFRHTYWLASFRVWDGEVPDGLGLVLVHVPLQRGGDGAAVRLAAHECPEKTPLQRTGGQCRGVKGL